MTKKLMMFKVVSGEVYIGYTNSTGTLYSDSIRVSDLLELEEHTRNNGDTVIVFKDPLKFSSESSALFSSGSVVWTSIPMKSLEDYYMLLIENIKEEKSNTEKMFVDMLADEVSAEKNSANSSLN